MNNLSKFMIRQQNLKFLKLQHLAEALNYTTTGKANVKIIEKTTPSKLSDNALSDFFNAMSRCANTSLE